MVENDFKPNCGAVDTEFGELFLSGGNEVYDCSSKFYLSYERYAGETAICIPGADGMFVFICVLDGDYRNELSEICKNETNPLGECLRFAAHHKDKIKLGSGIEAGDFVPLRPKRD